MSPETKNSKKVCRICQSDVAQLPRVKDPHGRYYCRPCYQAASRRKSPPSSVTAVATPMMPTAIRVTVNPIERPRPFATLPDFLEGSSYGFELTDVVVPDTALGAVAKVTRCPACNIPLSPNAENCVACGTTAQSATKAKRTAAAGAASGLASLVARSLGNYAQKLFLGAIVAAIAAAVWCAVAVATGN